LNKEFIERSNLFNFSSPEFIVSLSKKLEPMISMQGDFICRVGEIADEMYFIQKGEVEVYATDLLTKLAILKEGSFFGEIGLIQKTKRTVFVRAKTLVVLQVLKKDDFDTLSEVYQAEFNYLRKVAYQRSQICHPEDIGLGINIHKNKISFHSKLERALSMSKGSFNHKI
jgi:CRP-like cAMP-binding protein